MEVFKMHLKTKDDSYCFQIESSNCDKIQEHQKDFEQQILFLIHFRCSKGFQTEALFGSQL